MCSKVCKVSVFCKVRKLEFAVEDAECIVEVQVQDAKGVGVIRGCKGPTFQPILLSTSNGVRAQILCGE